MLDTEDINHIHLPSGVLCPTKGSLMLAPGEPVRIRLRKTAAECTRACTQCDKRHTPKDFKESPEYAEIKLQTDYKRPLLKSLVNEDMEEESVESEIQDESHTIEECDQELFSISMQYKSLCDKIADAFQHKVDCSPRISGKVQLNSLKQTLWRYYYKDVNKALCPCCLVSEISYDIYVAGHIHPESRGGPSSIDNLLPICLHCNSRMGVQHLYTYTWKTYKRALWSF